MYPYRITLDGGPVVFDPTRVQWDGEQRLRRDSPSVDFVRAPDGTAAWIVMTDTTLDADAYAADLAEKMRTWNGCAAPTGFTPFEAGGRPGVAFIQACGPGGAEVFTRGVVVGDGQALFAFSDGRAGASAIDGLIALLQGVDFTGPSGS
ncbi:MAG TPA: hypothetical protein VFY23_03070 [Candidatus Limnocylindrales bacterium]|nr:hypothetical protein [Candidatus Limnocylindrales bacterium]